MAEEQAPEKKTKIVIMEDEELLSDILTRKLRVSGCEVFQAADGKKGLELIKKEKPDLILTDLVMPVMSGFELMEELKKDEELAKIPVIVISNSGSQREIERSFALGAADYITKTDFNPWEIVEMIKKYRH